MPEQQRNHHRVELLGYTEPVAVVELSQCPNRYRKTDRDARQRHQRRPDGAIRQKDDDRDQRERCEFHPTEVLVNQRALAKLAGNRARAPPPRFQTRSPPYARRRWPSRVWAAAGSA